MRTPWGLGDIDWTLLGYTALALGTVAAIGSAVLAMGTRSRRSDSDQEQAAADARATIKRLAESPELDDVPEQLAQWEVHAAAVARRQLDLSLKHSAEALRQSVTSFRIGMAAASLGFLAVLGSLGWLLVTGADIAWLGVISGAVCEAVAVLFFSETRSVRARATALFQRAQTEADRVVRARSAMSVVQSIDDPATRQALLADIGRWLLIGGEQPSIKDLYEHND
ncbi:MAG TPA: hypothetical protein VFC19_22175 [Candidatus Limnocylindrales bacterium]|nr:hypothetical protein [Candidatus Limnocylindrales bacterium]